MIFRDKQGNLINIARKDYNNESSYYSKILDVKGCQLLDIIDNKDYSDEIFEKINKLLN